MLPVTTLTLARGRLESLGFSVAPDAAHPFGTGNCCVFFANGTYLEPLTIVDRDAADTAASEGNIFVRRLKRFTERTGEGFAMLAFLSENAEKDQAKLESAMVSLGPLFRFSRTARRRDGSEFEVAFALAFAAEPIAPDATFFACQPIDAANLWDPELTNHPNRASGVIGATAVAADPEEFQDLLSAVTGRRLLSVEPGCVEADGGAGKVRIVTPAAFAARYGIDAPEPRRGLLLAAFDLAAGEPEEIARFTGPNAVRRAGRTVVGPAPGLSTVISFEHPAHD